MDKTPYVDRAVALRREFLELKVKLNEFQGDIEATLGRHKDTLQRWSIAKINDIISTDLRNIGVLQKRLAIAKP